MTLCLFTILTLLAGQTPATRPVADDTVRLVFSIDQGFGNGVVVNRDLAAVRRIARAMKTLRPRYEVYALLEPQVADKGKLDAVLDVLAGEDVPFVFDVYSSDAMTLGTTTTQNAPADGPHGVAISIEDLTRYKKRYPRHLAGLRIMEVFSQDFTVRAVRTTNPEWNTAGWKLPPDEFFQPRFARPFLAFARDHRMFVQWSDWHWYHFATWDEPMKRHEQALRELLTEFAGVVTVTYANNQPAEASVKLLDTWHEAVEPFVAAGAAGFGLSDQAWLREPETQCPVSDIIAWARRAIELKCRLIQFEPVWYFYKLPRGTFGPGDYTTDPQWRDAGEPLPSFEHLVRALTQERE